MFHQHYPKLITGLFTALGTIVFISPHTFAQDSPSLDSTPLTFGIYDRGVQRLQIIRSDESICIHGIFNAEVQAQAEAAIEEVRQIAIETEMQLQARLQQEIIERREQIELLLQDESQLNAAIESGQLTPEAVQQIQNFKDDPQALDAFFEEQTNEVIQQARERLEQKRIEAEEDVRLSTGNVVFQGVASLDLTYADINTYTVNDTSLIVLPQEGERVLLGEPDKLQEFYLAEDVSLPDSPELQQCLASQQPYSQFTQP